jgi:membrane fusion protein, multidrug efflux system
MSVFVPRPLPSGCPLATTVTTRYGHAHKSLIGWASLGCLVLLTACGGGGTDAKDSKDGKAAGAQATTSLAAPGLAGATTSKAPLLLSPEDVFSVVLRPRASGPVVTGSIQPARRADLRAEVAAVVLQVYKDNGDSVKAGDLLMKLDATSIRDNLSSAEESSRAAAQAFEQVERTVARLKSLQAQGMTSLQALEDAEVRRNSAQSELLATRARVVAARQQLSRTEVRAPFDGVVSERKANAGDTAGVGKELLKVIDPRSMRFEGLVSADRLGELKLGQRVLFRINGVPNTDFNGTVKRLDAAANATTRQVEVVIAFDDGAAPKVAGLYAEGRIESGSSSVLMLPESALARTGDSAHVWRIDGRTVKKVAVQVGERDERSGAVVVKAGLAEGDKLLARPGSSLSDGQGVEWTAPVAARPELAPAAAVAKIQAPVPVPTTAAAAAAPVLAAASAPTAPSKP